MKFAAIASFVLGIVTAFFGIRYVLNLPEEAEGDVFGNVAGALIPCIFFFVLAVMFWMKAKENKES